MSNSLDLVQELRVVLGTAFALYVKTQAYHWNVEGPDFGQLHALFGDQYADVGASLDDIAENIRKLDAYAPMSMERFLALSEIQSDPGRTPPAAKDMLMILSADNEVMIAALTRALEAAVAVNQQGVANYLGGRIEMHQKHRWMLRASAK